MCKNQHNKVKQSYKNAFATMYVLSIEYFVHPTQVTNSLDYFFYILKVI